METNFDSQRMEMVRRRLGFVGCISVDAHGWRGGLNLLWKNEVGVDL